MSEKIPGYMKIPTAEQLAEALENVGSFHDMSAELIAPELLANLLDALAAPTVKAEQADRFRLYSETPSSVVVENLPSDALSLANLLMYFGEEYWQAAKGQSPSPDNLRWCQNESGTLCVISRGDHLSDLRSFVTYLGQKGAAPSLPAAGSAVEEVEVVAYLHERSGAVATADNVRVMEEGSVSSGYTIRLMTEAQCLRMLDQQRAALSAQQSAPERVSVPVELLRVACSGGNEAWQALEELRSLLASHQRGEA